MVDFQKKGLDKKKVFVVRDEAPYFSEALGFSLPSLLVNPALSISVPLPCPHAWSKWLQKPTIFSYLINFLMS